MKPPVVLKHQKRLLKLLNEDEKPLIPVAKAAEYYGIKVETVRNLIDDERLSFAFGLKGGQYSRGVYYISKSAWWNFETGGAS